MKKVFVFLSSTFLLVTMFSCNKENLKPATPTATATWTVNGASYSAKSVDRSTAGGIFQLVVYADNSIQVFFPTTPAASGSYKVVSQTKISPNTLASNEIAVLLGVGSTDNYYSAGTDDVSATVTVGSDGKVKVVIPSFVVGHVNSVSGPMDNTTATATLIE